MIQLARFIKAQRVILKKTGKILMRFKKRTKEKNSITNEQIQEVAF